MKSLLLLTVTIFSLPTWAFVAKDQQPALLEALNKIQPSFSHVDSIRCSSRTRACAVKLIFNNTHEMSCVISGLGSADEIYTLSDEGAITIAPYFTQGLDRCIASK